MNITIAGTSVAGLALAAQLLDEAHKVTVLDDGNRPRERANVFGCSRAFRSLLRRIDAERDFPLPSTAVPIDVGFLDRPALFFARRAATAHRDEANSSTARSWLAQHRQPRGLVERLWSPLCERVFGASLDDTRELPWARFLADYLYDDAFAATPIAVDLDALYARLEQRVPVTRATIPSEFPDADFVVFADRPLPASATPFFSAVGHALRPDYPPGIESAARAAIDVAMHLDESEPPVRAAPTSPTSTPAAPSLITPSSLLRRS